MNTAGSDLVIVTTSAGDIDWLTGFARSLVAERVIACANIIPAIRSVYRWEGQVAEDQEALAILHTTAAALELLQQRIAAEHPYAVPQVVILRAEAAANYLAWLGANVR
ncbi:MAG: divalent-cation tolerance protein CutA [Tetrasphaera sp.]